MSVSPDYVHDVHVQRRRTGWVRWYAVCPCGWSWTGTGSKEDAERAGREHEGLSLTCICYSAEAMEYGPRPCPACLGDPDAEGAEIDDTRRDIREYLTERLDEDQP